MLLLTAQRRDKVVTMRRDDIADGVWTIPTERREKGNGGKLKLPQMALDIIAAQPQVDFNPYVFAGTARGWRSAGRSAPPAFISHGVHKEQLDEKLDIPHWTLHDLRRTARSLMAKAGVADNVAERVLGHVIPGVQGVYNRHAYFDEKADALARLATVIEQIINPPDKTNVVELNARR